MSASCLTRTVVIAVVLLLLCRAGSAQSVSEWVAKGDVCDAAFHPGKALESYLPAERLDPKNVRILLRIARQYRHLMTDTWNVTEKLRLGGIALDYGIKAAALAPNDSEAQLCQAITYGKMLPFQGNKERVDATPRIKAAVDRALKLDPRNDSAWHVLGRWHQSLANVTGFKLPRFENPDNAVLSLWESRDACCRRRGQRNAMDSDTSPTPSPSPSLKPPTQPMAQ